MFACFSASSIAILIELVVLLISTTTPLFNPFEGASPKPLIFIILFFFKSYSAINTIILVVPISITFIISLIIFFFHIIKSLQLFGCQNIN